MGGIFIVSIERKDILRDMGSLKGGEMRGKHLKVGNQSTRWRLGRRIDE